MDWWQAVEVQIGATLGRNGHLQRLGSVTGGDIHRSFRARFGATKLFVKSNQSSAAGIFEAEYNGLAALRQDHGLYVPDPICHGTGYGRAWLVMEFVALAPHGDSRALGRGLAALHRLHGARFGWSRDNYIGATPQPNAWTDDWLEFWWRNRLAHQAKLAVANGHPDRLLAWAERLKGRLPELFSGYAPKPSLLHGDLWGGNHGYTARGRPVIFDPACYYGDRETDLAMTELFGGFDAGFYAAYQEAYPLHSGYRARKRLYQLYHVLNHLNLFGRAWQSRAESMLDALLHGLE